MLLRAHHQNDSQLDQLDQPTRPRRARRRSVTPLAGALGVVLAAALLPGSAGLAAAGVLPPGGNPPGTQFPATPAPTVVSAVPSTATPQVTNGEVDAIASVGSLIVLGGTFSTIQPPGGGTQVTQTGIVAFDAATGAIDTAFAPSLNGAVKTLIPGPVAGTVYAGGTFTSVNGATSKLALLDLATGRTHAGFVPPTTNGQVNALVLSGGRLFVGGGFTKVNGATHDGLVALSPTTGAVSSYLNVQLTGHHGTASAVPTPVGTRAMTVSPDGTKLMVIGNFISAADSAGTTARNQIVRILLGTSAATVDRAWSTVSLSAQCSNFDSYVDDVKYSPDGSYFVVVTTGGPGQLNTDGSRSLCDAASGWSGTATGTALRPTWVDYTGQDTLLSVAITSSAIYVGGHMRWMNNSTGTDSAGEGAVPRPSLAALDPANGLPLAWNPGRDPRGNGVSALLATSTGLYEGSDTNFLGNNAYVRPRIGFFPLASGSVPASAAASTLPGDLYVASPVAAPTTRTGQHLTAAGVLDAVAAVNTSMDWSQTRGAFVVGGTLFYGKAAGGFFSRSITETSLGSEVTIDPYDDPAWSSVQTGSGQTYQGVLSSFYSEIPTLTSAFYSAGRLYYTQSGHTQMFSRAFTPDSGIVGADETTVVDGLNWSTVTGATAIGTTLYYSNSTDKQLHALTWSAGHASGTARVVSTATTWSGSSLFAVSDPTTTTSPLPPGGGGGGTNPGLSPHPPGHSAAVPLQAKGAQALVQSAPTVTPRSPSSVSSSSTLVLPPSVVVFRIR